jgi:hypothetical protein
MTRRVFFGPEGDTRATLTVMSHQRHTLQVEPPPDPHALAGERRSRELAPYRVLAFELELALRQARIEIGEPMERLARSRPR